MFGPIGMASSRNLASVMLAVCAASAFSFDVTAKSALIMDEQTGKILWQKNSNWRMHPASTTKIMTGLLLLENTVPAEKIVAPAGLEKYPESSLHLKKGEIVSAKGMLYAIMLRSANDACVAIAHHLGGSVAGFAKLMNKRAKELGCKDTNFVNPNGLTDPKHLTTAYDLALMAREAMKVDAFREAVKTQKYQITRSINQKDLAIKTHNKWLAKDLSADGIKTGYTRAAGRCYVGSATRDGYRLITVILRSENWQVDHQAMLDWAYANHYRERIAGPGVGFTKVAVQNGDIDEISVSVKEPVERIRRVGPEDTFATKLDVHTELTAPISAGQELGTATFSDASGWSKTVPIVAAESVDEAPSLWATPVGSMGSGILMGTLSVGIFGTQTRRRRTRTHAKHGRLPKT
jgi:D-alanyl-D-alanine carboxypeptidase (penicillin-binding protein 5/6)